MGVKKPANLSNPVHFFAMGFGSGLSPIMPGTCGTIVAIPIYLLLSFLSWQSYLVFLAVIIVIGFWLCDKTSRNLDEEDPPRIVWDEISGFLLTMFIIPFNFKWIILGFILFRLFDIWKPWPISWINANIHNGYGIMADDLLAAIYSWTILQLILWIIL